MPPNNRYISFSLNTAKSFIGKKVNLCLREDDVSIPGVEVAGATHVTLYYRLPGKKALLQTKMRDIIRIEERTIFDDF